MPARLRCRAAVRQGRPGGSGRRWGAERSRPEAKRQTQTGFVTPHLPWGWLGNVSGGRPANMLQGGRRGRRVLPRHLAPLACQGPAGASGSRAAASLPRSHRLRHPNLCPSGALTRCLGVSTLACPACPTSMPLRPGSSCSPAGTRSAPRGGLGRALLLSIKWFLFASSNLSGYLHATGWARSANSAAAGLAANCRCTACSRLPSGRPRWHCMAAETDGQSGERLPATGQAASPGREEQHKGGGRLSHLCLLSAAAEERGGFWDQLGTQAGAHSPVSQLTHHFPGALHGRHRAALPLLQPEQLSSRKS